MPPSSWAAARSASSVRLTQRATVYGEDIASGLYSQVLIRSLRCRLISRNTNNTGLPTFDRAEDMAGRDFWFDPTAYIPEGSQVEVDGIRWQLKAGTFQSLGDCTPPAAKMCMAVRQQVASF